MTPTEFSELYEFSRLNNALERIADVLETMLESVDGVESAIRDAIPTEENIETSKQGKLEFMEKR